MCRFECLQSFGRECVVHSDPTAPGRRGFSRAFIDVFLLGQLAKSAVQVAVSEIFSNNARDMMPDFETIGLIFKTPDRKEKDFFDFRQIFN